MIDKTPEVARKVSNLLVNSDCELGVLSIAGRMTPVVFMRDPDDPDRLMWTSVEQKSDSGYVLI